MKKIEKLTEEQENQLIIHRDKWLGKVFNYECYRNAKFYDVQKETKELYGLCGFKEPVVLFVDSKYPNDIKRNKNNQLHNVDGPAITFSDGYNQHYVNGVYVLPSLFNKLKNKEYTFEDFSKEENEEVKSLVLSYYEDRFGGEFVYRFLSSHLKEIDTFTNVKSDEYMKNTTKGMNLGVYTLFKGVVYSDEIAYVRCYCPSTDRMFFLGVDPRINNAKDAIASLCLVPSLLKNSLVSINRQGEMFSFNFDEATTKKLKENKYTKKELSDLTPLSGVEYFNKLKFEY